MPRYLLARVLSTIPVLFVVSIVAFSLTLLLPGDPVLAMLDDQGVTEEVIELRRRELGLDKPIPLQYASWLGRAALGDFGDSTASKQPVLEAIAQRMPVTLTISLAGWMVGMAIAFPLGILAALYRSSWLDVLASGGALAGVAIPNFWLGILLIIVFAVQLQWLPSSGFIPPWEDPVEGLRRLVLPAVTLGTALSGTVMRQVRSSLLDVLNEDYVRTARAKGLAESRVVLRHALRNSLLPVVTIMGLQIANLLNGTVIIEQVFAMPGMGRLAVNAIFTRDFPVIQGFVLFVGVTVVIVNLVTDLAYAVLDPRVKYA